MSLKTARESISSIWVMIALILITVAMTISPGRAQTVRSFTVDARLRPDDTLDVNEQIVIDFSVSGMPGFYRVIPTGYDNGHVRQKYQFKLLNVAFDQGPCVYKQSISNGSALIQIGDPYRSLMNMRILSIHYVLRNVVDFSNRAHMRWDAIGNSWPMPIEHFSLTLKTPFNPQTVPINCAAMLGSGTKAECEKQADAVLVNVNNLSAGDSLVLNFDLPPGAVREPSVSRRLGWFLGDWWPAVTLPTFIFFALTAVRWACVRPCDKIYGKIYEKIQESPLLADQIRLPENLSPAELGTLLDNRCDVLDLTATLIDLAARGYLRIAELKSDKFVSFSNRDYLFMRLRPLADPLLVEHEKLLMSALFTTDQAEPRDSAKLSQVKARFFAYHPQIEASVFKALINKGQLLRTPADIGKCYIAGGSGLLLAGLMFTLSQQAVLFAMGIGLVLAGVITLVFAPTMPSRTILGCRSLSQANKFRGFLLTANADRIRALDRGDGSLFGHLLPYALVMGATDKLADGLKDVLKSEPIWYRPYYDGPNGNKFSPESFVTNLGSGMRTIERSFAF